MKICGVIAEFNPFHNGHRALIEQARLSGADRVVVVMSGSFTQRGEPAVLSKWARTRAALSCGADLVLELPLPYALSSAERFGFGGVSILDRLGVVDSLMFGAECEDTDRLKKVAQLFCGGQLDGEVKKFLSYGISYAAAVERAIESITGEEYASVMQAPNNILGVQYIRAIISLNSRMVPIAAKRIEVEHDQPTAGENFASASYIRNAVTDGRLGEIQKFMPPVSFEILLEELKKGETFVDYEGYSKAVLSKLRSMKKSDFEKNPDVTEGLHNRIASSVVISRDLNQLYELIKTKRYALSRIRRIVSSAFLGVRKEDAAFAPSYARVLGFNENGREVLSEAAKKGDIPIVVKYSDIKPLGKQAERLYELECRATDQYNLFTSALLPCGMDKTTKIIRY